MSRGAEELAQTIEKVIGPIAALLIATARTRCR
jgi:hypothetical protein